MWFSSMKKRKRRDMGVVAPCIGTELTSKGKGKGK